MKTIFPNKLKSSVSFNLTALGRTMLKELSASKNLSQGDIIEYLAIANSIKDLVIPGKAFRVGIKGGRKSHFFGKNRGITTALSMTEIGKAKLDKQAKRFNMSRGDMVEYLLIQADQLFSAIEINPLTK